MQLSTRPDDCWSAYFLSALEVRHNRISLNESCETVNPLISAVVIDLRDRHLEYWTPDSDTHPREHNSKRSTHPLWCALPIKRALVTHSPNILPKHMFLNLSMSYAVQLVSDFVFTPYVFRQRHGIKVIPPPVTCVMLMVSKIGSRFFSTASSLT